MTLEQVSQSHIDLGSGRDTIAYELQGLEQVFPLLGPISLLSNME